MRKLLLGMTDLKFIPYSSIVHQFDHWKDTKLKSYLFSGFGCQSKPVEGESLSQMVTRVRTHPSLFSSFKNNLCTKNKYKEGFFSFPSSKRQENQMEKPYIKLNIPKSVWGVKTPQFFPGPCVILHNSHLPVKMACLTYRSFETQAKMCGAAELTFSSETLTSSWQIWHAKYVNILRRIELYRCTIIISIIFSFASLQTYTMSTEAFGNLNRIAVPTAKWPFDVLLCVHWWSNLSQPLMQAVMAIQSKAFTGL